MRDAGAIRPGAPPHETLLSPAARFGRATGNKMVSHTYQEERN